MRFSLNNRETKNIINLNISTHSTKNAFSEENVFPSLKYINIY